MPGAEVMIKKILIVDDSKVARIMLEKCLPRDKAYEIIEAVDGQDGVNKYREFTPDITFMDLTMPVLDGFKATAEIMKLDKNAVVIIATADIQPKSVERVTALGAFTVIKKPVKPQLMQEVLAAVELKLSKLPGVKR